jgi:hypothetical protein
MEVNDRKSRLSLAYISAVAAHAGYQVGELQRVDKDSIDGTIILGEDRRPRIEFQAKATAQRVRRAGDHTFRLSVKNYDDLRIDAITPRLLIVVFLPAKEADWLVQSEDELRIRHCGYWLSLAGQPDRTNRSTVSVKIPRSQMFDTAQLRELMGRANRGEPL